MRAWKPSVCGTLPGDGLPQHPARSCLPLPQTTTGDALSIPTKVFHPTIQDQPTLSFNTC